MARMAFNVTCKPGVPGGAAPLGWPYKLALQKTEYIEVTP
jgi:hypothetical protein